MDGQIPGDTKNLLQISMRDPVDEEDASYPFWLNWTTKQLFQFDGKWIPLRPDEK